MPTLPFVENRRGPQLVLIAGTALAIAGVSLAVWSGSHRRSPAVAPETTSPVAQAVAASPGTPKVGDLLVTQEAMELAEIKVAPAASRLVAEMLAVSGVVEAGGDRLVRITARVPGKVVSLAAVAGDAVRAGQTLGVIESSQLALAQATYRQAVARLALAKNNLERQRKLANLGVYRSPAVEQARKEAAAAQGEVDGSSGEVGAAKNAIAEARSEVAAAGAMVASAEADAASAQSEVAEAENQLGALQAAIGQAQAQAEVAASAFDRAERLLETGIISKGQWELKRGEHRRARAEVDAARANLRQGQSKIETAKARLKAAQAKVNANEARVRQVTAAVETGAGRKEQAEAKLAAAKNHARIAAQTLVREEAVAKGNYLTTKEIVEAEAALRQAEIEQQGAEQNVRLLGGQPGGGNTISLITPIAGRVQERNVSLGETVDTEHPLYTVLNLDLVWAQLAVAPNDLPLVRPGQRVELTADAAPGRTLTGTVSAIGSAADEKTRAVRVRCALVNQHGALRPETFVRGNIVTDVRKERVVVPAGALQEHNGKPTVYVEKGGLFGGFEVRHVQLGVSGDGWREISSGLKAGEKIAVNGTFYLKSEALKSSLSDGCCAVDKGG